MFTETIRQAAQLLHSQRLTRATSVSRYSHAKKSLCVRAGLWGLVNNAGVCVNFGDAELSLMSNFRGCMEVNFFGTLSITKSFLPLLRQAKGRIVTISSPAGVCHTHTP